MGAGTRRILKILEALFLLCFLTGGTGAVLSDSGPVCSLFPQLAVGGGWSCDVFITNEDSHRVDNVTLSFFDGNAAGLTVTTNLGNAASFSFNLGPGGTQLVRVSASGASRTGYAVMSSPAGSSVHASLIFYYKQGNQVLNQLGVQQLAPSTHFSFPAEIDSTRGVATGVALCNPIAAGGSSALEVIVSLIDEAGKVTAFRTLTLKAGGYMARFLNEAELFPGVKTFRGSVNAGAVRQFGLVAMRVEGNSVGSLTVNSSPVIGAFIQTGLFWAEAEPNNATSQAQALTLPTRVSAGFAQAGDVDIFRFTAKSGDIVTALTQLTDLSSDPVLRLLKADGTILAQNDQNGLVDQKDAFLQARLPADGDYYIRVEEAGGHAGAALGYELHVRILGLDILADGPRIEASYPESGVLGNTIDLEIQGNALCAAGSINIVPSDGLTLSDVRSASNRISARVTIDPEAATGPRLISIRSAFGISNAASFQVANSGSTAPRISSLQVGATSIQNGSAVMNVRFNFVDPDGDLIFRSDDFFKSAKIWFIKSSGSSQCRATLCSSLLHLPGKTSGMVNFNLGLKDYVDCSSEVGFELVDSVGNISNRLTFQPQKWYCGP